MKDAFTIMPDEDGNVLIWNSRPDVSDKAIRVIRELIPGTRPRLGDLKMSLDYWLCGVEPPPAGQYYIALDFFTPEQRERALVLVWQVFESWGLKEQPFVRVED